jgi:hypothetical protein
VILFCQLNHSFTHLSLAGFIHKKYIGCFKDKTPHDLPTRQTNAGTPLKCSVKCKNAGFAFAGVENGNQCWCGNSFGKYGRVDESQCSKRCWQDRKQICGAENRISIYRTQSVSE